MRVRRVAANVADNAELALRRLQALLADERWDGLGEVDAVDKDVRLNDLGVWAVALLGLCEIPLEDLGAVDLLEQVDGTRTTAAEGAEDETARLTACNLLTSGDIFLELGDQLVLVVVVAASVCEGLDAWERLAVGVCELPRPCLS